MVKYKIPAVDGAITDEEIAKTIAEKTVYTEKDEEGNEVKKTIVKDWVVHTNYVIIETEKEIKELEKFKI